MFISPIRSLLFLGLLLSIPKSEDARTSVTSINNNIYTQGNFKVAYAYEYVPIFNGLLVGLFDRQKAMDFKRYLLLLLHHLAIDRANNRSFLISSQLNRSEVHTFFPRVGLSKIPTFTHHKGRNLFHKVPVFPHISPGSPPPSGKPMTSALVCRISHFLTIFNPRYVTEKTLTDARFMDKICLELGTFNEFATASLSFGHPCQEMFALT